MIQAKLPRKALEIKLRPALVDLMEKGGINIIEPLRLADGSSFPAVVGQWKKVEPAAWQKDFLDRKMIRSRRS